MLWSSQEWKICLFGRILLILNARLQLSLAPYAYYYIGNAKALRQIKIINYPY